MGFNEPSPRIFEFVGYFIPLFSVLFVRLDCKVQEELSDCVVNQAHIVRFV